MTLIECLYAYRFFWKKRGRKNADGFLESCMDPSLHEDIRASFDADGDFIDAENKPFKPYRLKGGADAQRRKEVSRAEREYQAASVRLLNAEKVRAEAWAALQAAWVKGKQD